MPGLSGTTLDHYHIQQLLGRGGMSEVYLAYDERMQRNVAIKVVGNVHADYIERFRREAEAISMLNHAHILPAFDYGEQGPWHYIVMPHIEYGTLHDRLLTDPLSLAEAGIILEQIAGALQFAHDQGIVHRDIKPSNILMRNDRYIYLADFGLAKSLDGGSTITQTGNLLGTPEYMAPELSEGPATTSSDLYALGILLYQMVAGQVPFTGETPIAVYWKQIRDQPLPPSQINPEIPPAIERVILRALDKQPARRYQTANELTQAYIHALTFPNQVVEAEERVPSYEPRTAEAELAIASAPVSASTSAQEGKLVLPNSPLAAPSATPQRRRFPRRAIPNLRRHASRLRPPTPPPLESLTPAIVRDFVPAQSQSAGASPPRIKRKRSTSSPRRRRRNPVLLSLIVLGVLLVLLVLIALPLTYLTNQANMQARSATATANVRANATATQRAEAKATAGVALTATSGTLILADPLSKNINGRWLENTACVFTDGTYHVRVQQTSFLQICPLRAFSFDNAAIRVDVSLLSGNDAGLLFRATGEQFYAFEITNRGEYFLRRHNSGTGVNDTYIVNTTKNAAIVPAGKNTLLVIASGDDFKLFINGVFLIDMHDGALVSGQVGFVVKTLASSSSGEGTFANIKIFKY